MANIKSAKKKIDVINRRNAENRLVKSTISTNVKKLRKMIETGKIEEAEKFSKEVFAYIASACSKGILHKNCASRKVGRLSKELFKAQQTAKAQPKVEEKKEEIKVEAAPVVAEKKPAAKKVTTAKTTTKAAAPKAEKPAAKTTSEKKTTTKKTTK